MHMCRHIIKHLCTNPYTNSHKNTPLCTYACIHIHTFICPLTHAQTHTHNHRINFTIFVQSSVPLWWPVTLTNVRYHSNAVWRPNIVCLWSAWITFMTASRLAKNCLLVAMSLEGKVEHLTFALAKFQVKFLTEDLFCILTRTSLFAFFSISIHSECFKKHVDT